MVLLAQLKPQIKSFSHNPARYLRPTSTGTFVPGQKQLASDLTFSSVSGCYMELLLRSTRSGIVQMGRFHSLEQPGRLPGPVFATFLDQQT
jgi:hypothetical protein